MKSAISVTILPACLSCLRISVPYLIVLSFCSQLFRFLSHSLLDVYSFFVVQALLFFAALATDSRTGVVPEGEIQLGVVCLMRHGEFSFVAVGKMRGKEYGIKKLTPIPQL